MASEHFRRRIALPLIMLLTLAAAILVVLLGLQQAMLAIPPAMALLVALLLAGFVLFVSATMGQNRNVSSGALGVALAIGLLGIGAAGVAGFVAGPREIEEHGHEEEGAEGEEGEDEGEGGGGEELPDDALVWVAEDINFAEAPETAEAGEVTIAIDNQGASDHDVTIDELDIKVEAGGGEVASETVEVDAGTYEYYCSVPGHEDQMNGEITFE